VIELGSPAKVSIVRLKEAISRGQRIEEFAVDARIGGEWREFGKGTTMGPRRIVRVPGDQAVSTDALRVRVIASIDEPAISSVEAFLEAEMPGLRAK